MSNLLPVIAGSGFAPIEATGGTVTDITVDGVDYRVHSFTSTGTSTFTVNAIGDDATVEYLIVAGGGGGGNGWVSTSNQGRNGGCGGAGGLLAGTKGVNTGTYSIFVGAGGAPDTSGQNSVALSLTAVGGGKGGPADTQTAGSNGGSGGGGPGYRSGYFFEETWHGGGSGTAGQGNDGADGQEFLGGGGGGAGGPGQGNAVGGAGITSSITGTPTVYAQGGGVGISPTANTGNGGLRGFGLNFAGSFYAYPGGPGASGIVVIRYPL